MREEKNKLPPEEQSRLDGGEPCEPHGLDGRALDALGGGVGVMGRASLPMKVALETLMIGPLRAISAPPRGARPRTLFSEKAESEMTHDPGEEAEADRCAPPPELFAVLPATRRRERETDIAEARKSPPPRSPATLVVRTASAGEVPQRNRETWHELLVPKHPPYPGDLRADFIEGACAHQKLKVKCRCLRRRRRRSPAGKTHRRAAGAISKTRYNR